MYETIKLTSYNNRAVDVRKASNKFIELVEEGLLDPVEAVRMCVKWMSEDEVKEMCEANEIYFDEEDENEED